MPETHWPGCQVFTRGCRSLFEHKTKAAAAAFDGSDTAIGVHFHGRVCHNTPAGLNHQAGSAFYAGVGRFAGIPGCVSANGALLLYENGADIHGRQLICCGHSGDAAANDQYSLLRHGSFALMRYLIHGPAWIQAVCFRGGDAIALIRERRI